MMYPPGVYRPETVLDCLSYTVLPESRPKLLCVYLRSGLTESQACRDCSVRCASAHAVGLHTGSKRQKATARLRASNLPHAKHSHMFLNTSNLLPK